MSKPRSTVVYPELAALVQAAGRTAAEVARRAGWSPAMLSAVLHGHRLPRYKRAQALADVLGVTKDRIPHWRRVETTESTSPEAA